MRPEKINDPILSTLRNEFEQIPYQPITTEQTRMQPRQMATGVMRGTQKIVNTDGSFITLGVIPDTNGEFGIAYFDREGNLIAKNTGLTDYKYDLETDKNYYQNGKLPDGSYGAIYAKSGYNVEDVIA